jgi:hypothetical protein
MRDSPGMNRRALGILLLGLAPGFASAVDAPELYTRAHGWTLEIATPEGPRSMTLRGDEAQPVNRNQIDVKGLSIFVYSGDASSRVTTILTSPEASFFNQEQRAQGPSAVRLIRDDVDITGEDWTYERAQEKVTIRRHVRLEFKEQLTGLLK